ncbi:hypothetical protein D3C87_1645360 [compost metagenome]
MECLEHRPQQLLGFAIKFGLGYHCLEVGHIRQRHLLTVNGRERGHEAVEVLLRTSAHDIRLAVPGVEVLGQIGLGQAAGRWNSFLQCLETG